VYRLLEEGLGGDTIAERLEGGAAGAWQYRRMVRALLDGSLPTAPTIALAAARRYRTVLKTPTLSTAARAYLQANRPDAAQVGCSDRDVIMRFRSQTRTTALPEEPILLRIYRTSTDSAAPAEATFHRLLDAADHSRTIGKSAGREWFLTHTKFLDEIARTLDLHLTFPPFAGHFRCGSDAVVGGRPPAPPLWVRVTAQP
jgi:hypothetical protein